MLQMLPHISEKGRGDKQCDERQKAQEPPSIAHSQILGYEWGIKVNRSQALVTET